MPLLAALALLSALQPDLPPDPPREFRAVWIATVDNIDWPSKKGLSTQEAQGELRSEIEKARSLHMNAVIFQVRPMADAFYESKLEPWSEFLTGAQGLAPKPAWDPLKFAIEECHKRGLELHAWFNPFRAWHPAAKSAPSRGHVTQTHPEWVKNYGGFRWLDPGDPAARAYSLSVIQDVLTRYDVDGVHIDDYFYPYPIRGQDFPDDPSYEAYGKGLPRADWRRANVDAFVKAMYDMVKKRKPWVKVGISPFGIYRPGIPVGIQSQVDQYDGLYADARKWLAEGWCDYFTPQLYWRASQVHQSYPALLSWWMSQNAKKRHLWPGNYASQLSGSWPVEELIGQIAISRAAGAQGDVFFSLKPFLLDVKGVDEALLAGPYRDEALTPASPWLGGKRLAAPALRSVSAGSDWRGSVLAKDAETLAIWARYGDLWTLSVAGTQEISLPMANAQGAPLREVAVAEVDRYGALGEYAIWRAL